MYTITGKVISVELRGSEKDIDDAIAAAFKFAREQVRNGRHYGQKRIGKMQIRFDVQESMATTGVQHHARRSSLE